MNNQRTKDAASGMVYLHEKGIVHRDLALRNLLVESTEKPGTKYIVKISGNKVFPIQLNSLRMITYSFTNQ